VDSFNPTTKTQAALTSALQAATAAGNPQITPAHLLMALLTQNDGIAAPLLEAVGVEPATIRTEAERLVGRLPSVSGSTSQPQLSPESISAITVAQHLATEMDDEYVSTEHLLVGLATGTSEVAKILTNHGASPEALREAFTKVRGSARVTSPDPEGSYQALEKYSTDLTARAREGKLDPVIGRDTEIRRVIQVLSRGPRTTRYSSVSPVSVRRRSSRAWPSASSPATSRKACATRPSSPWTWARWWPVPSTAVNSRSASRPSWMTSRTRQVRSSRSSTSCTPSSAPVPPARARWTPAT